MTPQADNKKPKRGRPCQPPEDLRSERVVTFLTKEEYRLFSQFAEGQGKSYSSMAHELMIKSLGSLS
jgi:hypothetical protein